jgi:hypothetical protein
MPLLHLGQVRREKRLDLARHGSTILLPLAPAHDDLIAVEIDVFHAQLEALL